MRFVGLSWWPLIILAWIAGCSGSSQDIVTLEQHVQSPAGGGERPAITDVSGFAALPQDEYVAPGVIVSRRGSEFSERRLLAPGYVACSDNCSETSASLSLGPEFSWAMYEFDNLLTTDNPLVCQFELSDLPAEPAGLHIGFSDYQANSWSWVALEYPTLHNYVSIPDGIDPVSPGGKLYVIVAVAGEHAVQFEAVSLYVSPESLAPPQNLIASQGALDDAIQLSWQPMSGAERTVVDLILVERAQQRSGPWELVAAVSPAVSEYTDDLSDVPWVSPSEKVYYRLTSVGDDGAGWPGTISAGSTKLADVIGLTATDSFLEHIDLTWQPVKHADGYLIEYLSENEGEETGVWLPLVTLDENVSAYIHQVVSSAQLETVVYGYRVKAFLGSTTSVNWSELAVGYCYLGAVTGFDASYGTYPNNVVLSWFRNSIADGYRIDYRRPDVSSNWEVLIIIPDNDVQTFAHSGLFPEGKENEHGKVYEYRIRVTRDGELSNDDSARAYGQRAVGAITSMDATVSFPDKIEISWTSSGFIEEYVLEFRNLDGGTPADWTQLVVQLASQRSFNHTENKPEGLGCEVDTNYEYRVKGIYHEDLSLEWGRASGIRSFGLPESFEASDGMYARKVNLVWQPVVGADGYLIEYRNLSGGSPVDWVELVDLPGQEFSEFQHTETTPVGKEAQLQIDYEYRLQAYSSVYPSAGWATDTGFASQPVWSAVGGDQRRSRCSDLAGPAVGEVLWEIEAGNGSEPVIGMDGTIFLARDQSFTAYHPDGTNKWTIPLSSSVSTICSPTLTDDGQIRWHDVGNIYSLDHNGEVIWSGENAGFNYLPQVTLLIADDGATFFVTYYGSLYRFSSQGYRSVRAGMGGYNRQAGAVNSIGDLIVGTSSGLFRYTPDSDSSELYTLGRYSTSSPAIGIDDAIYTTAVDGTITAVEPDGSIRWEHDTGAELRTAPAVTDDGTVIATATHGALVAINPDGTEKWTAQIGPCESSPAVDVDGNIFVTCAAGLPGYGRVMSFSPSGEMLWHLSVSHEIDSSNPVIGLDGMLFIASTDGYLIAVGSE